MASMQPHALDQLWATVSSRKGADPASSWTAKLLSKGVNKCAQKVGEEATEVVIEAASGNAAGVVSESADLLYHLEVLWAATGVEPEQVYAELRRREGTSGIAEKAARPSNLKVASTCGPPAGNNTGTRGAFTSRVFARCSPRISKRGTVSQSQW